MHASLAQTAAGRRRAQLWPHPEALIVKVDVGERGKGGGRQEGVHLQQTGAGVGGCVTWRKHVQAKNGLGQVRLLHCMPAAHACQRLHHVRSSNQGAGGARAVLRTSCGTSTPFLAAKSAQQESPVTLQAAATGRGLGGFESGSMRGGAATHAFQMQPVRGAGGRMPRARSIRGGAATHAVQMQPVRGARAALDAMSAPLRGGGCSRRNHLAASERRWEAAGWDGMAKASQVQGLAAGCNQEVSQKLRGALPEGQQVLQVCGLRSLACSGNGVGKLGQGWGPVGREGRERRGSGAGVHEIATAQRSVAQQRLQHGRTAHFVSQPEPLLVCSHSARGRAGWGPGGVCMRPCSRLAGGRRSAAGRHASVLDLFPNLTHRPWQRERTHYIALQRPPTYESRT